ncbi:MAG: DUF2167 domain-containing protein [Chthoniobacter sp.]|nr:DUF2167 domain-containing protein [Chthoniobacter sp.]
MKLPGLLIVVLALTTSLFAQDPADETAARAKMQKVADGLNYQKGEITLRGGLAKIHVPEEFRYLDGKDAATVLSKIWGNPPGSTPLGMLLPAKISPASPEAWAVIITYDEDGYVKDDEAAKMDYSKLLKEMKEGTREASKERVKAGYGSIELVGWATPPRYDQATHKMYWAKELKFDGGDENTLNYNIRMLGRRGVLVLNAVASVGQLKEIEEATPAVLAMVDFQEGHRYTDFNASTDKVATYGIAALVAGGLATKAGLFKGLLVALLAAKKLVIVGVVAVGAWLKKVFSRKTG